MNKRLILNTIARLLQVEAAFLVIPLIFSLIYKENISYSYLIPILILIVISIPLSLIKTKESKFMRKTELQQSELLG